MPLNKDLKRLVRARMGKTGESYTTARAQILAKSKPQPVAVDFAALAGMKDAQLQAKTGRTWEQWVRALDRDGAARLPHREIAALVSTKYKAGDWWSQTVTVGYERIKGLRAKGQRRDGTYEATKSRTFNVPVATLFDAWADPRVRRQWLNDVPVRIRTATAPKSMRIDWSDRSIIAIGFLSKGASKSVVAVQHTKLKDKDKADAIKQYWTERLDALGEVLAAS
jgi:hypothetical protein